MPLFCQTLPAGRANTVIGIVCFVWVGNGLGYLRLVININASGFCQKKCAHLAAEADQTKQVSLQPSQPKKDKYHVCPTSVKETSTTDHYFLAMGNRYSHIIPPNSTCAGYRCQRAVKEDGTSFIFECLECGDKSLFCSQVHRDEKEAWHARRCQGRRQNQTAAHTVNHDMSKFGIGESDSTRKEESDSDDEGDYEDCLTDDEGDEEDERLGDSEAGNREREDKDENQEAGPKPHVVSTRKSDDAKDLEAVYQYATNPEDDSLDYSELGIYTREQLEEGKALARSYESEQEWARGRNDGANGAPISNDHQRAESRLRSLSQRLTGSYRQGRLSSRDHDRSPVDARRVATPTRPSDSSSGLDAFPDDGLGDGYDVSDEEERRRRRQFLRQTQEEGNEHEHENDNDQEEQEGSNEDAANKDIDSETGSAETMEELQDNFSSILMVHAGATFRDNEPISEATDGGDAFANRVSPATTSETPADVE